MNKHIFLLLGTNQGDKLGNLTAARTSIQKISGRVIKSSKVYKTSPWGKSDQEDFYNQAIEIVSPLPPEKLLESILEIETQIGRTRFEKWGPRLIDIDILLYGNEVIDQISLTIPHPRMHERRFALIPLCEIAPDVVHPIFKTTVEQLLRQCQDELMVEVIS
jgi:2-amino-4-hydroxy-6-hydroxymethyldihydropteridine diphosphokinase